MRPRIAIVVAHSAMLLVAYVLFEASDRLPAIAGIDVRYVVFSIGLVAAMTGLALVLWQSGSRDRILFVFSTILSLFLVTWTILRS
jgi:hypothetical protein